MRQYVIIFSEFFRRRMGKSDGNMGVVKNEADSHLKEPENDEVRNGLEGE